jgi:hypothetical protein
MDGAADPAGGVAAESASAAAAAAKVGAAVGVGVGVGGLHACSPSPGFGSRDSAVRQQVARGIDGPVWVLRGSRGGEGGLEGLDGGDECVWVAVGGGDGDYGEGEAVCC